jgi:hypothetical protein
VQHSVLSLFALRAPLTACSTCLAPSLCCNHRGLECGIFHVPCVCVSVLIPVACREQVARGQSRCAGGACGSGAAARGACRRGGAGGRRFAKHRSCSWCVQCSVLFRLSLPSGIRFLGDESA